MVHLLLENGADLSIVNNVSTILLNLFYSDVQMYNYPIGLNKINVSLCT